MEKKRKSSGEKFTDRFEKVISIDSESDNNADKMGNTGDIEVSFGGANGERFASGGAKRIF